MENNKVVLADGTTLMDITNTTAVASDVASGKHFYNAAGVYTEGTAVGTSVAIVSEHANSVGGVDVDIVSATDNPLPYTDTLDAGGGTIRSITADVVLNLQSKEVTPSNTKKTVLPDDGYDGLSEVIVQAPTSAGDVSQDQDGYLVFGEEGGGITWTDIGSTTVTPSVRNLYAKLADSTVEWGEFTLASTPTNEQVDLFTLQNIAAPCAGIVFIDKDFYQGASGLPNNGNTDAIAYLHCSKAFLNPAKESALASEYPCYGFMAWGATQTVTATQAGGSVGASPFDNSSLVGRGYFQWDGQTLKWRSQYGGQQYTTFVAGRTYFWIAY